MTRYGTSFWLAGFPRSKVPAWPRHRGDTAADVAIVGGGLTGCAAALAFASAGFESVLIESERVGRGATGAGDGILSLEPWPSWRELELALGRRDARLLRDLYRHAALDFAASIRRLKIRCGLEPQRSACVAVGTDAERMLERDWQARKDAGLDGTWLAGAKVRKEIGAERGTGLFTSGAFTFDPYRACVGLARAAAARGCEIVELAPVTRIRRAGSGVELQLPSGTIATRLAVLCTGAPPAGLVSKLTRHFRPSLMHHVVTPPLPPAVRKAMGTRGAVVRFAGTPARRLRWTDDHRVIFSGGDHQPVPARSRERAIIQRTGQLMYELSLVYPVVSGIQPEVGWDTALAETADGLPCIGPHRAYPHHLFALGADRAGAASAWLAAKLLVRHASAAPAKGDELFGFGRLTAR
jgi:glycine/D-amino acid oxidase-like deaminating enzyme